MRAFCFVFLSVFVIASTPTLAKADVSPAQVWDSWQSLLTQYGATIETGPPQASGTDLVLSDVKLVQDNSEGASRTTLIFPELAFLSNEDGTVSISLEDKITVLFAQAPAFGAATQLTGDIAFDGLLITASGTADEMRFDYSGNGAIFAFDEILSGEQSSPLDISSRMEAFSGAGNVGVGANIDTAFSIKTERVSLSADIPDPATQIEVTIDGVSANSAASRPSDPASTGQDLFALLGASATTQYTYDRSAVTFAVNDPTAFSSGTITSGAARMTSALDAQSIQMDSHTDDLKINLAGVLPTPIALNIQSLAYMTKAPSAPTDDPRDIALQMNLNQVTASESTWAQYDPDASLPRAPATVLLDLTGKATLGGAMAQGDFMAPMLAFGGLRDLQINQLFVDLIGAQLSGSGALEFDKAPANAMFGMPQPMGTIDLRLLGGTVALDKLTALGLVPQETAIGAKMMMGLFTTAGPGADEISTQIRLTQDGGILVNGQRIK